MKILILEDQKTRIDIFKKKFQGHDVYFFDQVSDAKEALDLMGPWDILFLDHDLDQRIFVPSEEPNTGYQFAKYIREKGYKFDQIILHSMNPVGVERMKRELPDAIIAPFPTLFK